MNRSSTSESAYVFAQSPVAETSRFRHDLSSIVLSLCTIVGFIVVAALALENLQYYPRTWFDEGINVLAASTLAVTGRYGLEYSDTFHAFDLSLSTGPTVLVPIALVFRVAGIGLWQARLVMAAYLLLTALGLYCVGRQSFGPAVGTVAVFVFAAAGDAGPFANGRTVVGEVPALAFLFWGAAVLTHARRKDSDLLHFAAGLILGFAIVTKNQFALIGPVIVCLWLIDQLGAKTFQFRQLVIVGIALAAPLTLWNLYQYQALGSEAFFAHLRSMSVEASYSSYATPLARILGSMRFLVSSGFVALWAAGLLYVGAQELRSASLRHVERLFLPGFALIWLGWFVVLSMGYPRYAVPLVAVCSLFVAKLVVDTAKRTVPVKQGTAVLTLSRWPKDLLDAALLIVLVMTVVSGIAQNGLAIGRAHDATPQQFAALVQDQVPAGALIENSDWEIDFLTQRAFYHPPAELVMDAVGVVFLHQRSPALETFRVPANAAYLVDGPYSKLAGVYRNDVEQGHFVRVASIGEYDLYRRADLR